MQNKNFFLTNSENHKLDTRQSNNLYLPQANLTIYQKRTYYSGIKIFNSLPLQIREVADNQRKFEIALNNFLHTYSFYSIEEYFNKSWPEIRITKYHYCSTFDIRMWFVCITQLFLTLKFYLVE